MPRLAPLILALCLGGTGLLRAEIRQFPQATIEQLGAALYEQDLRAEQATNLLAAGNIDPDKEGIRGWIVGRTPQAMLFRFIREKGGVLEAFADVMFDGQTAPHLEKPASTVLSPAQLAQFKARLLAVRTVSQPDYNYILLPDPERPGYLVYALVAANDANTVFAGGHFRLSISKDGEHVVQTDELLPASLKVDKQLKDAPPGSQIHELNLPSPVSDLPLETTVYLSLQHRITFLVSAANGHGWKVQNGRIEPNNPASADAPTEAAPAKQAGGDSHL